MALNLKRDYENEPLRSECMGKEKKTRMTDAQYRGLLRLNALCLGVICILQATLNIALRLHFNPKAKTNLLNTSWYNKTVDDLQTNYTNLVKKTDQLQTLYSNLVKDADQLMEKREGVQNKFFTFDVGIMLEWKHFNSSFYYIATEKKNWVQSRQECKNSGADLAIIDSQEEEDFIIKQLKNKSAWVGLVSKDTEKEWKWVDGTALKTGDWAVEQPNGKNSELHAKRTSLRQNWISVPCAHEEWWVCEKLVFQ